MCEVDIHIKFDDVSNEKIESFIKEIDERVVVNGDSIVFVEDTFYEDKSLFILGEVRWSLRPEEAIKLLSHVAYKLCVDVNKLYAEIKYLERGFSIGGMYVLKDGVLKQGDMSEEDWKTLSEFGIDNPDMSDKDWDCYWTKLFEYIESVDLVDIHSFK